MDFSTLMSRLDKEHFFKEKKEVLKLFTGYYTASQVVQVINSFMHATDKLEILQTMQPRLGFISGLDGKMIVDAFTFKKLEAVEVIACRINDQSNKYALIDAITSYFDKEKARKVLDATTPQPPQGYYPPQQQYGYPSPQEGCYGQYPPPPCQNPQGNYPGTFPPLQGDSPGGFPPVPGLPPQ